MPSEKRRLNLTVSVKESSPPKRFQQKLRTDVLAEHLQLLKFQCITTHTSRAEALTHCNYYNNAASTLQLQASAAGGSEVTVGWVKQSEKQMRAHLTAGVGAAP